MQNCIKTVLLMIIMMKKNFCLYSINDEKKEPK